MSSGQEDSSKAADDVEGPPITRCCSYRAPPELGPWLAFLGLSSRQAEVETWCEEQGASFLEEVAEHMEMLAMALGLDEADTARANANARGALLAVMHGESPIKGANVSSLRTLSTFTGSDKSAASAPDMRRHVSSKTPSIARVLSISATVGTAVQNLKRRTSVVAPDDCCLTSAMGRTCTVEISGPRTAGIMAHLAVNGGSMQIAPVARADAHRTGSTEPNASSPPMTPMAREAHQAKAAHRRMSRCDTLGVATMSGNKRETLVDKVHAEGVREARIDSGQTGNVFALEVGNEKIAVFKPVEGEKFSRKSLDPGQGSVREEAVYLIDRIVGSQAGVPVTSRASITVDGKEVLGSVQAFVENSIGFIEDFAMPRDLSRAEEFVPQQAAEFLALLDMRVFNMDRHSGNLLLLQHEKPHTLGPIDHGCCLPNWWALSEAIFDAWVSWPQLQCEPCEASRDLARKCYDRLEEACEMVRDIGLDEAAIVTLRLCTLFIFVGVTELALPCGKLAMLMMRDEDTGFQELSWLERKVMEASVAAGARCSMKLNDREDEELVVEENGEGLRTDDFLGKLEEMFRSELAGAVEGLPS